MIWPTRRLIATNAFLAVLYFRYAILEAYV